VGALLAEREDYAADLRAELEAAAQAQLAAFGEDLQQMLVGADAPDGAAPPNPFTPDAPGGGGPPVSGSRDSPRETDRGGAAPGGGGSRPGSAEQPAPAPAAAAVAAQHHERWRALTMGFAEPSRVRKVGRGWHPRCLFCAENPC
jgi:hypothetical protein